MRLFAEINRAQVILYLCIATPLVAILVLVGCNSNGQTSTSGLPTPVAVSVSSTTAAVISDTVGSTESSSDGEYEPFDVVTNAVDKLSRVRTGILMDNETYDAVTEYTGTYKIVMPDRMWAIRTSGIEGEPPIESIQIGKQEYLKQKDGTWKKFPARQSIFELTFPFTQKGTVDDFVATISNVTELEPQVLNGEQTRVFHYVVYPRKSEEENLSTGTVWIANNDGLPRKLEVRPNGSYDATKEQRQKGTLWTMTFSELGADIVIEPPPLSE